TPALPLAMTILPPPCVDTPALPGSTPPPVARPGIATPLLRVSSYVLMAGALLLLMLVGLLPGLLFACLGFLVTRWVAQQLAYMPLRLRRGPNAAPRLPRWAQVL